jgi:hypothetical protein
MTCEDRLRAVGDGRSFAGAARPPFVGLRYNPRRKVEAAVTNGCRRLRER